jgi:hypothetical protein
MMVVWDVWKQQNRERHTQTKREDEEKKEW